MSVRLRKWKDKEGSVQQAWIVDVKYRHADGTVLPARSQRLLHPAAPRERPALEARVVIAGGARDRLVRGVKDCIHHRRRRTGAA